MKYNKLRLAIRSTAVVAVLGVAAQASAVEFEADGYSANLYGFARIATTYDFDENIASGGQSGNFSAITGGSNTVDGHFGMDANTSRLGVSVMTPQDVKMVVEFDFDDNDSNVPRIRHAYGEYNGVLIGRNWSNYNSWVGNTSGLDFDGLPGLAGTQSRTEQVRYTTGPLSVSLEQPFNYPGVAGGANKTPSPALTARFEDSQGGFSYSAAVMAKQTAFDNGTTDDSAVGYGAFLAAKMAISDMLSVQGAINFSDGANAYVYRAGGNFGQIDAYNDAGEIETVESVGGALGVSMALGGGRSINLGYGTASVDLDDAVQAGAVAATLTDTNTMVFLNYMWSPVKNVSMGVEFANLETETQGGSDGDANRLMYLAQYNF
jgi:hypothetical protein